MSKKNIGAELEKEIAEIRVAMLNTIVKIEQKMVEEIPKSLLHRMKIPVCEVANRDETIGKLFFMKMSNRDRWEFFLDKYNGRERVCCTELEDPWALRSCIDAMEKYYHHCLEVSRGDMEELRKFRRELRQDMELPELGKGPFIMPVWKSDDQDH